MWQRSMANGYVSKECGYKAEDLNTTRTGLAMGLDVKGM